MIIQTLALILSTTLSAPFAIENTTVHLGNGEVLENTTVVVANGKIKYVGKEKAPQVAKRVDGTGKILTPGFIEVNCPMGLVEVSSVDHTVDTSSGQNPLSPGFKAAEGFNPNSVRIPLAREGGVTRIQITSKGGIIAGQGFFADMTGTMTSRPNLRKPTVYSGSATRWAIDTAGGSRGAYWMKLTQLFADARYYQKNKKRIEQGENRELVTTATHLAAMKPLLLGQAPLMLSVNRASDILRAIEFARTQKIRLVILGGAESWLVADAIKAAKVPVIVRPSLQEPGSFESLASRDDLAAVLSSKGVDVIISAGGWFLEVHRLRQEAGIAVANGLSYKNAMRAITTLPARIFGLAKETGSIEVGKQADLVLWSADPFENQTVAENVWIAGKVQNLETRQKSLAKRYLKTGKPETQQGK